MCNIIRGTVGYLHINMLPRGPHAKAHATRLFGEHGPGLFHIIVANGGHKYPGAVAGVIGIGAALLTGNPHRPYLRSFTVCPRCKVRLVRKGIVADLRAQVAYHEGRSARKYVSSPWR